MSLFNTLLYNDDLVAVPTRLARDLLNDRKIDAFLPVVIRALVFGALVSLLRKGFRSLRDHVNRALFPTAYIHSSDPAFTWIMAYIASDSSAQRQIKDFQLYTTDWSSIKKRAKNALHASPGAGAGEKGDVGRQNATWVKEEVIGQVIPTYHQSIRLRHNNQFLWVTRKVGAFARSSYRSVDHLQIRTIAFQPNVLKDFLAAAHQAFFAKEETELHIFPAGRIKALWLKPVSRPTRPWSSVILPGQVKEDVLRDVQRFLSEKEIKWYASRGIPHRRGYLLHGLPGSGKTSLVTALASKLRLDIYIVNPAQRGMDDAKLCKLFRDCPARSVILIEDIDCIFSRNRQNILAASSTELANDENDDIPDPSPEEVASSAEAATVGAEQRAGGGGAHDLAPSTVTMSGLLNAIDGVSSFEGCVLIATTNHIERLDPALSRAGRFDVRIPFSAATKEQARALYLHFYPLEDYRSEEAPAPPPKDSKARAKSGGGTISFFHDNGNSGEEEPLLSIPTDECPIGSQEELERLADGFATSLFSSLTSGDAQQKTDQDQAARREEHGDRDEKTAENGSEAMTCQPCPSGPTSALVPATAPESGLSMASLQAYLLRYKDDPVTAVRNASTWAREMRDDDEKGGKVIALNQVSTGSVVNKWGIPFSPASPVGQGQGQEQGRRARGLTSGAKVKVKVKKTKAKVKGKVEAEAEAEAKAMSKPDAETRSNDE